MSVPKFDDFNKRVKDLFKDDYTEKCLLKIKHAAPYGVSVTSETEYSCKGATTALPSKLTFKWKHPSGFAVDKLQVKHDEGIVTETSMSGVAPGLKFIFKGDHSLKGDLSVDYNVDNAHITGELDVVEFSKLKVDGVFGYQNLLVGGNLSYKLPSEDKTHHVEKYTLSAGYNAFPVFASVGSTNLQTVDLHVRYDYDKYVMAAVVNHKLEGNANPDVTIGGTCQCSKMTNVRAKVRVPKAVVNSAEVSAAVSHSPVAGLTVVGAVTAPLQAVQAARLGLQLTLG